MKGPATARRLYPGDPSRRPYSDVDLLVPVERFDDAQQLLRRNHYRWRLAGVRDNEVAWHEMAWGAPESNSLTIDLHRGFAGVTDPSAFFTGLWSARDRTVLAGSTVWIPSVGGTALILALHAANPGKAKKPLRDLQRAHQIFERGVWQEAAAVARSCGAESACRAGLELLDDGRRLADGLGMGGQVTADTWLGGRQYDRVSVNLATALAEPGIKATLAHITRRVVPTPAFIRLSEPSAGRGPGALARAYLHRIGGAVIAAPRAVRDVVVARRAVRPGPPSRFGRARRIAIAVDPTSIRVGAWAWWAHRRGRDQLRRTGLTDLDLPAPAAERPKDRRAVLAVLRLRGATCLERSLVLQRFDAAAGRARVLIVGVTGPGDGFRAHAWLDGDRQGDTELREIVRVAAPASWMVDRTGN